MMHAQLISANFITGKLVWAVRDINGTKFGDEWLGSLVIIKKHWFSKLAYLALAENIRSVRQYRELKKLVRIMGFKGAYSMRHGRKKVYKL